MIRRLSILFGSVRTTSTVCEVLNASNCAWLCFQPCDFERQLHFWKNVNAVQDTIDVSVLAFESNRVSWVDIALTNIRSNRWADVAKERCYHQIVRLIGSNVKSNSVGVVPLGNLSC